MSQRKMLGEILVDQGLLCATSVERVVAISKNMGRRFGAVLEEMGLITGEELATALAIQHNFKTIFNFARASFPKQLLDLVPAEVAMQNLIFPLKLEERKMGIAVADPTNMKVVNNLAANNNLSMIPFVSSRKEIKAAICRHYFSMDSVETTRKTVLVVEDDKLVLEVLIAALKKDYEVYTAMDGIEAYKVALTKKPNVILTDKEMPKLDGYRLLEALKGMQDTRGIPIILISGSSDPELEAHSFEKGFFDFVPKTVKPTTLLTRVNRAYEFYQKQHFVSLR